MKALSVKQPWASCIIDGGKTVECRTWKTSYRGPLLICSSKGDIDFPEENGLIAPGGMALGVVELVDIARMTPADHAHADLPEAWHADALKGYAWHLKLLYPIKPVPVKGKLNLFTVDVPLEKMPDKVPDHWEYLKFLQGLPHETI